MSKSRHLLIKLVYYSFVVCILLVLLFAFKELFIPLVLGALGTLILGPLVDRIETKGLSRLNAVLLLYAVMTVLIVLGTVLLLPHIISQAKNLIEVYPVIIEKLHSWVTSFQSWLSIRFPNAELPDLWSEIQKGIGADKGVTVDAAMGVLSQFMSIFSTVLFAPVVSFFLLLDGSRFQRELFKLIPNQYFEMSMLLFHKIVFALKNFLRGQVIDAAAVGGLTALGLTLIGLPYGMVIGLVAGIANMIPYLGPIMGFIPAALVLMTQEGTSAFSFIPVVIVFFGVQFIEGTFIYPIAVGKSVNLHPLIVMLAVTLGGQVAGLPGMLLVIPLISMVKVSLNVLSSYLKGYGII